MYLQKSFQLHLNFYIGRAVSIFQFLQYLLSNTALFLQQFIFIIIIFIYLNI